MAIDRQDTLIGKEALLLAKYLRKERKGWKSKNPHLCIETERKKGKNLILKN
jgi:hypothetical protein